MAEINPSPLPPGYQPTPFGYEINALESSNGTRAVVFTLRTVVGSTTVVFSEDEFRGMLATGQREVGDASRIEIARTIPPANGLTP